MNFKYKNVLVYGTSSSGEWASKLLRKLKANVFLYDDNKNNMDSCKVKGCYILPDLNSNFISQFDYIVLSPAIESTNPFVQMAKSRNIKIFSELEFASLFCKKFCAVTGTNGKTTTVQLITAILNKKYKAIACGNIGYPVSKAVLLKKKYIKVMEVSSFMLENADSFNPQAVTCLNITPDHLIRHKTMEEYTNIKMSIFKNLDKKSFAVTNLDENIKLNKNCINITYSQNKYADVYTKNGYIYIHSNKFLAINELNLKGKHNIYNVLCAICFGVIYKVNPTKIKNALLSFKPEQYRIEKIATVNGINFINDSKSTNIASTLASVETIKGPIILLLGGSNKNLDYTLLFNKLSKRVKQVIAYGEIAEELSKSNNLKFNINICNNLSDAFDFAVGIAKSNDNILLSPASASYDQFKNYIERGKAFNAKVLEYEEKVIKK